MEFLRDRLATTDQIRSARIVDDGHVELRVSVADTYYPERVREATLEIRAPPPTYPRLAYFDIRQDLVAGRDRHRAVADLAARYRALVEQLTPDDLEAKYAWDLVESLVRAAFDPVYGNDVTSHRALLATLFEYASRQHARNDSIWTLSTRPVPPDGTLLASSAVGFLHGVKPRGIRLESL